MKKQSNKKYQNLDIEIIDLGKKDVVTLSDSTGNRFNDNDENQAEWD